MNKKRFSFTIDEATKRLEKYCLYQPRCHQEVRNKLTEMRMIPEAIDQIVVHLIENDYLNEELFAKEFAKGKFRIKNWGKSRIRFELSQKGISSYNINSALSEIDDEAYLTKFNSLSEKRWKELSKEKIVQKKKRKLADYLFYRGWENQLVYDRIAELSRSGK